jgi:uncharacterized protein YdhG (YjbR/CyaY superfamily)
MRCVPLEWAGAAWLSPSTWQSHAGRSAVSSDQRDFGSLPGVSADEVDQYLRGVDEPKRGTLQALRRTILEIVPDAEQVISYRIPAFRVRGQTVAGFAAFKEHLSYLPFSGSVLAQMADELNGYTMTKSALHFPVDRPLPKTVVKKLIAVRLEEVRSGSR